MSPVKRKTDLSPQDRSEDGESADGQAGHDPDSLKVKEKLSLSDACRALDVSPNTIRRWEKRGLIVAERTTGGHRRFKMTEIQRVLRSRARDCDALWPHSMGPVQPPQFALPQAADALASAKSRLRGIGTTFYEWNDMPHGYFSSGETAEKVEELLNVLELDLRRGDYSQSVEATRLLCAGAVQRGTRIIECYRFWEMVTEAIRAAIGVQTSASSDSGTRMFNVLLLCLNLDSPPALEIDLVV